MSDTTQFFDVAVVGAGPAGSAAAITLRRRGASVVVLESRSFPAWRIGETLPPTARPLLDALGVLSLMESDGHLESFGNCSSWGTQDLAPSDFIFDAHGHGWQLDRARFDGRLVKIAEVMGAAVWRGCRLLAAEPIPVGWELKVAGSRGGWNLHTKWVIDATGRSSSFARKVGSQRANVDKLLCVYAIAVPVSGGYPPDTDTRTIVEAVPDGWWYSAQVPGGRRTVAWLTDPAVLADTQWREVEWFRSLVGRTRHLINFIDGYGYCFNGPPACTSASSSRSKPWCGRAWIAVGDAGLAFDPLSSQGLLNALYTGMRGADAIADALAGDTTATDRYSEILRSVWEAYLQNQRGYYRIERRWADQPFWRPRHQTAPEFPNESLIELT